MPREIYDEVSGGNDDLVDWIKDGDARNALLLDEDPDPALVQQALRLGYQSDEEKFTDGELIKVVRDAFWTCRGIVPLRLLT